jgi:hypothetical protein
LTHKADDQSLQKSNAKQKKGRSGTWHIAEKTDLVPNTEKKQIWSQMLGREKQERGYSAEQRKLAFFPLQSRKRKYKKYRCRVRH